VCSVNSGLYDSTRFQDISWSKQLIIYYLKSDSDTTSFLYVPYDISWLSLKQICAGLYCFWDKHGQTELKENNVNLGTFLIAFSVFEVWGASVSPKQYTANM